MVSTDNFRLTNLIISADPLVTGMDNGDVNSLEQMVLFHAAQCIANVTTSDTACEFRPCSTRIRTVT